MQPHLRSDGKLRSHCKWTTEDPQMTLQQRQVKFGNQWYIVQTTARGSRTIPTRQNPELGQRSPRSHGLRLRAPGDRDPSRTFLFTSTTTAIAGTFVSVFRTRFRILRSERVVYSNTLILSVRRAPCVFSGTHHNRFQISLLRSHVSTVLFDAEWTLHGSRLTVGVRNSAT